MATITAEILVGWSHQNHGRIVPHKIDRLRLSENSRPCWTFGSGRQSIRWVPESPETILEDGLLLTALHVLRHEDLLASSPVALRRTNSMPVSLGDFDAKLLQRLRAACREYDFGGPGHQYLVLCVFEGSSIKRQLPVIAEYRFDCEVLIPTYRRWYSDGTGKTSVRGSLPHRAEAD